MNTMFRESMKLHIATALLALAAGAATAAPPDSVEATRAKLAAKTEYQAVRAQAKAHYKAALAECAGLAQAQRTPCIREARAERDRRYAAARDTYTKALVEAGSVKGT